MTWYAIQDSDWDWDSGECPTEIVDADTPEEAVRSLLESNPAAWADGGNLKVSELRLAGFAGYEIVDGKVVMDEFQPFDDSPLQGRALTLALIHRKQDPTDGC